MTKYFLSMLTMLVYGTTTASQWLNDYFHSVPFTRHFCWAHHSIANHSGTFERKNNRLLTEIRFESGMEKWKFIFHIPFLVIQKRIFTYSVLIWTSGGFAVAFCITKNNFVTISITWPVWNTKSPFLRPISDWKLFFISWDHKFYLLLVILKIIITNSPWILNGDCVLNEWRERYN